jgi:hypothetical protein
VTCTSEDLGSFTGGLQLLVPPTGVRMLRIAKA